MAMKKRLLHLLSLASACCLCACAVDLGAFEKSDGYESYYESLGKVRGLYDDGADGAYHEYSVKDSLFNSKTVEKMEWDEGKEVAEEQYVYLVIPFKKEIKIQEIALYVYSPQTVSITVNAFYFESEYEVPKKIKYLTSPDTEPIYDSSTGEQTGEVEIDYDDPPKDIRSVGGDVSLVREEWTSFVMSNFRQSGYVDGYLRTVEDSYLYLRFENNSGWNRDTMVPVTFKFINLIMRAVE